MQRTAKYNKDSDQGTKDKKMAMKPLYHSLERMPDNADMVKSGSFPETNKQGLTNFC